MEETRPQAGPRLDAAGLTTGQLLGKCRLERLLGRGGMGAVYLARHLNLDVPVAVKVMSRELPATDPAFAERFLREARLAARLAHPNVVSVLDADRDPATGLFFIVQEYVDGGSVHDLVRHGPLAEAKARQIVAGVLRALTAASKKGIVHRDIKPENVLLTSDGAVKLADLGLAKQLGPDAGLTASRSTLGTPLYMSPEQIKDTRAVDARSDLYSVGATFYHLLTGHPPFPGENVYGILHKVVNDPVPDPRDARPEVSDQAARICMRLMAKEVEDRYQTAEDVLRDLSRKVQPTVRQPRRRGPRPAVLAAGLAGGIVATIALVWGILALAGGESAPPVEAPGPIAAAGAVPEPQPGPLPPRNGLPDSLREGAILALSFDEATFENLAGRGGRAEPAGGEPRLAEGRIGRAARFDGDDALRLPPGLAPRTLAMWFLVEPDGDRIATWFAAGGYSGRGDSFLLGTYRQNAFAAWNAPEPGLYVGFFQIDLSIPAPDLAGGWHHLVFSWDGRQAGRIALDGEFVGGEVLGRGRFDAAGFRLPEPVAPRWEQGAVLGHLSADWWRQRHPAYFRGRLDEVAAWDRELTDEEILSLARAEDGYCEFLGPR